MQDRGAGAWIAVKWVLVISFMLLVYAHALLLAPGWLKGARARYRLATCTQTGSLVTLSMTEA